MTRKKIHHLLNDFDLKPEKYLLLHTIALVKNIATLIIPMEISQGINLLALFNEQGANRIIIHTHTTMGDYLHVYLLDLKPAWVKVNDV